MKDNPISMKAVILAAGVGSRLGSLTKDKPKCLLKVGGKTIIDYQIESFASAGINDILIVVGYQSKKVIDHCNKFKQLHISFIENSEYERTNSMYSLYLAIDKIYGQEFILCNGDMIFEHNIAADMINYNYKDLIAVNAGTDFKESTKIIVEAGGFISNISKNIPHTDAYGSSMELYKFSAESSEILLDRIKHMIESEGNLNDRTEIAIQQALESDGLKMMPFDNHDRKWVVIDTYHDLMLAMQYFWNSKTSLKDKKIFFIDLDGTVYIENELVDGVTTFLNNINNQNNNYYFLSNNSSRSKEDYVIKMKKMGIEIIEDQMILSTDGLIEYLIKSKIKDVFVVCTRSMEKSIAQMGIETQSNQPEYVVVGYDTELVYDKLRRAAIFLNNGVKLLATHCDIVCPSKEGPIPDIGSILALLEKSTNKKPEKVFGKPNIEMIEHILKQENVEPDEIIIIGDRLYTDMELAKRIGCDFILVLSGETTLEDLDNIQDIPDLIVNDVGDITLYL